MSMTTFRNRRTCVCVAEWIPQLEKELQRRKMLTGQLEIYQLTGNAAASAGTHGGGGAIDCKQLSRKALQVVREMGGAGWHRVPAQGFMHHWHIVLNGCPHNAPARYQVNALAAGFNGLGSGGRGGRDDGPAPRQLRTWKAGINWAKAQQKASERWTIKVMYDFVEVRTFPGMQFHCAKDAKGNARFLKPGQTFTTRGKMKTVNGMIWHEGLGGGQVPNRNTRRGKNLKRIK